MSRPSTARSTLAIALVFAFVAAQVGGALHVLLVEHVTCEHGDSIHVAGDQPVAPARPAITPDQTQGAAGDIHDHCVASHLTSGQRAVGAAPIAPVQPAPGFIDISDCAPLPPRAPTLAVYRLAPKSSPPASSAS